MVSIGTIFTFGIIGAIAAGSYALYRNSDKIRGALARGTQKNLTTPLGNYFDNLWKNVNTNSTNPKPIPQKPNPSSLNKTNVPSSLPTSTAYVPPSYGNTGQTTQLPPAKIKITPTPGAPIPVPLGAKTINELLAKLKSSKAGYYYQNFAPGGRADRQIKLKQGSADKLKKRGYDLTFLTSSQKLSNSAFILFGKSKNYL